MSARAAVLLAAIVWPAAASAARPSEDGLVLGARVGWGEPAGRVARGGEPLGDLVASKLPIWVELGYRFTRHVWGEIYFEIAPAEMASRSCAAGDSCTASNFHGGLAIQLRLAPGARVDPWLGVGAGVEVLSVTPSERDPVAAPGGTPRRWAGIELPLVEGGVDLAITDRLSLGPYASVTFAQYTSEERRPPGGSSDTSSVDDRVTHRWMQAGLKLTLRL